MATWLVTGANRGIGLELVRQILEAPDTHVIATARSPQKADALQQLKDANSGRVTVLQMDIADEASIKEALVKVQDRALDVLVNNAGILGNFSPALEQDPEEFKQVLLTNLLGTWLVTRAFLPQLRRGRRKLIVNISSDAGCLSQNASFIQGDEPNDAGMALSYRTSKCALNMETTCLANALKKDGITTVAMHPGFVVTDMGQAAGRAMSAERPGYSPSVSPEESVHSMLKYWSGLKQKDSGSYMRYDGEHMPW